MTTATTNPTAATPTALRSQELEGRVQAPASAADQPDVRGGDADDARVHALGVSDTGLDANPTPDASARSVRVGDAAGDFATIRVSYGPQNLLVAALDEARLSALSIRERRAATGRRIPMPVMRTIAEMGVGKTWAGEKLIERCAPSDPRDTRRPVLLIELDTSGKQISLPRGILKELGKRGWNLGTDPEILWTRAIEALQEFGVEILIFDEMDRAARRPSIGPVIGGDIMDLLVKGDVAVAFLGTSDANKVFNRCPPLKDRMKAPVVMKPLDWLLEDEKVTFIDFLAKMDQALVAAKLIDAPAGLENEAIAKPLWDVCRGRLRPLCLLLEEAVTAIHRDDRAKPGARLLTTDILAQAVEDLSIPAEVVEYNPFTEEMPS